MKLHGFANSRGKNEADDSNTQIKLLSDLASGNAPNIQFLETSVLSKCPDWNKLYLVGLVDENLIPALKGLHSVPLDGKLGFISSHNGMMKALLQSLFYLDDMHVVHYVLTTLYGLVRDDSSRYDIMCKLLTGYEIISPFNGLLSNQKVDVFTADKAAFLLSGFMCRARSGTFLTDDICRFVVGLLKDDDDSTINGVSAAGILAALINILKISSYRDIVWSVPEFLPLLEASLSVESPISIQYQVIMCIWLLSFEKKYIDTLNHSGLIRSMALLINETRAEKFVRVFLKALKNLMKDDEVIETLIETNTYQTLTILEYEKWRDPELYDDIHDGINQLDTKLKCFSNFGRYCIELDKGSLKWSILHSETFWRANIMHFEKNEFIAVRKLRSLLSCDDPLTVSIACYDLGEFARFHPAGKKICQKLNIKGSVLLLISHTNREIAREALLCLQKLMLDKWQDVASSR